MSQPSFRPFDPAHDSEEIVALLTGEEWIYRPQRQISAEVARKELADGRYEGPDVLTLIIELDGEVVGIARAEDLAEARSDPQLDFHLRAHARGRGIGLAALRHITAELFARYPTKNRIEGQTRRDNIAMRRVFERGGYVQEAVYRRAWPAGEEGPLDGIGYAMLRQDWESGTTTPLDWDG
jgi:RimJ/RimL family protein N-acetyltransferase